MSEFQKLKRKIEGFTLIEIIVILLIIAALLIFSYVNAPTLLARARDAKRKADIRRVGVAIQEHYEDTNCYPISVPLCDNAFEENGFTLMSNIPCDPKTQNSYVYVPEPSQCPSWFQLYGNLEYTEDPIIEKVGCTEGCGPDCQFNYGISSPNQKLNPFCEVSEDDGEEDEGSPEQYVCDPSGVCEIYFDPELSGCPDVYINDPTCQDQCGDRNNRCHDERGKFERGNP